MRATASGVKPISRLPRRYSRRTRIAWPRGGRRACPLERTRCTIPWPHSGGNENMKSWMLLSSMAWCLVLAAHELPVQTEASDAGSAVTTPPVVVTAKRPASACQAPSVALTSTRRERRRRVCTHRVLNKCKEHWERPLQARGLEERACPWASGSEELWASDQRRDDDSERKRRGGTCSALWWRGGLASREPLIASVSWRRARALRHYPPKRQASPAACHPAGKQRSRRRAR